MAENEVDTSATAEETTVKSEEPAPPKEAAKKPTMNLGILNQISQRLGLSTLLPFSIRVMHIKAIKKAIMPISIF